MIGTTLAHYRITEQLGKGGMGEVYRATDTKLNRDVALKILPESFAQDPHRLGRFEREAQVLASLNHPNIAAVHGVEEQDGRHALVMELVEGEDLSLRESREVRFHWKTHCPLLFRLPKDWKTPMRRGSSTET